MDCRFRYSAVIAFLLIVCVSKAQDRQVSESLIQQLESDTLTKRERYDLSLTIANKSPDYVLALVYANKALVLARDFDNDTLKAKAYEEIGASQRLLGNNPEAIEATLEALAIYNAMSDSLSMAAIHSELGANYLADRSYGLAVKEYQNALRLFKYGTNELRTALAYINLGEAYRLIQNLDSAIFNFGLALSMNDSLKNEVLEGYARGNLGMALRSKGQLYQAKAELTRANEILTKLGDPYSVSVYTADLAQISIAEGKPRLAEEQLLTAYNMAKREGLKEQIRDFSEMLVNFYEGRNDFEQALGYQKVYQIYQDSLVNKENVQEMERLQANYQIEKREDQIDLLEKLSASQQTFNLALGGGLLIFGILAAMLYQSNKQKREANAMLGKQQLIVEKREEEKAILLKELNHRVKNNLQMVSSLLSLQGNQLGDHPAAEAINAGKLRVEALSMIHQKLYQDDVHTSINIKEHLVLLVSNLMYSYGDPFEPVIKVTPAQMEMDIDTAIPLSLIVNELVTNAMKYAYEGIDNPEMSISLDKSSGLYHLDFSDNGVGIDHEKNTSNSFGIRLIKSLVAQLNGTLEIVDLPQGGTQWLITLNTNET